MRAIYQPGVARPVKFEHDGRGRKKVAFPNGVTVDDTWDDASRMTETVAHTGNPAAPIQKLQ